MRTLLALSALTLAAACTHPGDSAPAFKASVEAMHRAQTVPDTVSEEPPEGSASVGVLAQERYRDGRTRPLMPTTTSSANPSTTN